MHWCHPAAISEVKQMKTHTCILYDGAHDSQRVSLKCCQVHNVYTCTGSEKTCVKAIYYMVSQN